MAEKLGVAAGVHELKIGESFFQSGSSGNGGKRPTTYHTIRYDFKPASSSTADSGFLRVDETTGGVSVTVPNSGGGETNFSGQQKKANQKECVLMIDRVTGEITLERLSSQILVKKTRPERAEKSQTIPPPTNSSRPPPPLPPPEKNVQKPQHPVRSSPTTLGSLSQGDDRQMRRPQSPAPSQQLSSSSAAAAAAASKPTQSKFLPSELSSASSSDSSSSDSDSDSNSNDDVKVKQPAPSQPSPSNNLFSMPDFLSGDMARPSSRLNEPVSTGPIGGGGLASCPDSAKRSTHNRSQLALMPQLLNDDLELSESDSD